MSEDNWASAKDAPDGNDDGNSDAVGYARRHFMQGLATLGTASVLGLGGAGTAAAATTSRRNEEYNARVDAATELVSNLT